MQHASGIPVKNNYYLVYNSYIEKVQRHTVSQRLSRERGYRNLYVIMLQSYIKS